MVPEKMQSSSSVVDKYIHTDRQTDMGKKVSDRQTNRYGQEGIRQTDKQMGKKVSDRQTNRWARRYGQYTLYRQLAKR